MNPRSRVYALLAVLFILGAPSARARHSFNDIFDGDKVTTLRGTISNIDWINPTSTSISMSKTRMARSRHGAWSPHRRITCALRWSSRSN